MRTTTMTLTPTTLLLFSACAYDPASSTDEDVLVRIEALETENETQAAQIQSLMEQIADLELQVSNGITLLTESRTVTVNDVAELEAALDELDRYRLARDVTYTIELADGTYSFTSPLVVNHPDGDRLQIVGNIDSPDAVTMTFDDDSDGVVVEGGEALGLLAGVTLRAVNSSGEVKTTGIAVNDGGSLALGDSVVVEDFHYGVRADQLSSILGTPTVALDGWLTVSGCTVCLMADHGSQVIADLASIAPISGASGFSASKTSYMQANDVMVSGGYHAFVVSYASAMAADRVTAVDQEQAGFFVGGTSYLHASNVTASGAPHGAWVESSAFADFGGTGTLEGVEDSIYQIKNGVVDITGCDIPNGVSNTANDVTDFVIGN